MTRGTTMRALQKQGGGKLVFLPEHPIPKVQKNNEVLIKVSYVGICGTDLHILKGEFAADSGDVVLGHEISGRVIEAGAAAGKAFAVGTMVAVDPNSSCGGCMQCHDGRVHFCATGGLRSTIGIFRDGGWADYVVVPSQHLHALPAGIPPRVAALSEPISCILRGVERLGMVSPTCRVLVMGAGVIGLLWTQVLKSRGFSCVTVSEVSEGRQALARKIGGYGLEVKAPADIQKEIDASEGKEWDPAWGYDVAIDCTGVPRAIEAAVPWLRYGGTMLIFGCCPSPSALTVDPAAIMLKELSIVGSLINPHTMQEAVRVVEHLFHGGLLDFGLLGIQEFELEQHEEAIAALNGGGISKAMFRVGGDE